MNKDVVIEKIAKNKMIKLILVLIFFVGIILCSITIPFCFPNVFIDPIEHPCPEPLITGDIGGLLSIIGMILMIVSLFILLVLIIKRRQYND